MKSNRIHYVKTKKPKYTVTHKACYELPDCIDCGGEIYRFESGKKELLAKVDNGWLTVHPGFSWDGLTWFRDIECAMEASLAHDALYQIIRQQHSAPCPSESRLIECADRFFYCMVKGRCSWLAPKMYGAIRAYQSSGSWKKWKGFWGGVFARKPQFSCLLPSTGSGPQQVEGD